MNNNYINLVKKWLKDPCSVSLIELEANYKAAEANYNNIIINTSTPDEWVAAGSNAAAAVSATAEAAYAAYAVAAGYWYVNSVSGCVKKYEDLTHE